MNKIKNRRIRIFKWLGTWNVWCRACSNRWGAPLSHTSLTWGDALAWASAHLRHQHGGKP